MKATSAVTAVLATCLTVSIFAASPKSRIDTPTLSHAGSTQATIAISVTAGATGLPAGFSLQWMTSSDLAANSGVWYDSADTRLCKGSFSGNANLSRYTLTSGQSVTVKVGDFLFDNGTSASCIQDLLCGTAYSFRAFGHATNTMARSEFTPIAEYSTTSCGSEGQCTYTQGYWKNHGPIPSGNNSNEWPVDTLTLGTVAYTDYQLLDILKTSAGKNYLLALAHQVIAAKLNIANDADPTDAATYIAAADALIAAKVAPPVGTGSLKADDSVVFNTITYTASRLTDKLEKYNSGGTGPGHCESPSVALVEITE